MMKSLSETKMLYGFRIDGSTVEQRQTVDWRVAFMAYAQCRPEAKVNSEAYLSAFCFGPDYSEYVRRTGSTRGFDGMCRAYILWFDIDRKDNLEVALNDMSKLCSALCDRYGLNGQELLVFFSGSKGFHIGLPLSICNWPEPSPHFHSICRKFAEHTAELANVAIDCGVYDKVRAFRAPNSRHPETGLYKRFLSHEDLPCLWIKDIVELAKHPLPFALPKAPKQNSQACEDWKKATEDVLNPNRVNVQQQVHRTDLNRATMDFVRNGAPEGERSKRLFSAAANLAEFGCSYELAWAFLSESALDSGLPPNEVRRQIECGLAHKKGK